MSDFKVGDRVAVNDNYPDANDRGKVGEVVTVGDYLWPVGVVLDGTAGPDGRLQCDPKELDPLPSKPLAFRVGDKVASIAGHGKWVGTIVETHPGHKYGWVYRVRYDVSADYHFGSYGRYMEGELQYAPIPDKPKRKFQVGDKVRFLEDYNPNHETRAVRKGEVGTIVATEPDRPEDEIVTVDLGGDRKDVRVFPRRLEVVKSQEFKLRVGDRIRNNLTGREGVIYEAPVARTLKVYDLRPPYRDGVPAVAVEEYEAWHPGTYEHTHRAHKIGPF